LTFTRQPFAPQEHCDSAISVTHAGLRDLTTAVPQWNLLGSVGAHKSIISRSPSRRRTPGRPNTESQHELISSLNLEGCSRPSLRDSTLEEPNDFGVQATAMSSSGCSGKTIGSWRHATAAISVH
jgi:hypothetical protein